MPVGTKAEQGDVEKRALRIKRCGAVGFLQCPLVASRCVVGRAICWYGMNVLRWHRSLGEHRFTGHPKVAFGMIVGDKAFVSPVPGHQLPRETVPEFV